MSYYRYCECDLRRSWTWKSVAQCEEVEECFEIYPFELIHESLAEKDDVYSRTTERDEAEDDIGFYDCEKTRR